MTEDVPSVCNEERGAVKQPWRNRVVVISVGFWWRTWYSKVYGSSVLTIRSYWFAPPSTKRGTYYGSIRPARIELLEPIL